MKSIQVSNRPLEASDVVLLSVLGAVHDNRAPVNHVIATAKEIAPQEWQPTTDLVADCVVGAINKRLLRLENVGECPSTSQVEITESGRVVLCHLLRKSIPCHWGGFSRTCLAAKLYFLECLDPNERMIQIETLAQVHRQGIEALKKTCESYADRRSPPGLWLKHEIERYQWELDWLDRLRSKMPTPPWNHPFKPFEDHSPDRIDGQDQRAKPTVRRKRRRAHP